MSSIPTKTRQYVLSKGSYKNMELKEATLKKPQAHDVLVKVHAVSLQHRDLAIALEKYQIGGPGTIPCSDMSGEVIAVGEEVTAWKKGDRVCANFSTDHLYGDTNPKIMKTSMGGQAPGVLTEFRSFPSHALVAFPSHLTWEEASTLPCAGLTAYNALHGPVPMKAGDTVLIQGTSGVSIFALQFAVASGATVIAVSSSDEKLEFAKKLGAKHTINYETDSNWDEKVLEITKGWGVDHVVEVIGAKTLPKTMNAVRSAGFVPMIGFEAQEPFEDNKNKKEKSEERKPEDFVKEVSSKTINIRGIYVGPVSQFIEMNRLITANPEQTKPVIDKVFNFQDAVKAYEYLENQKNVGKVVICVAN